MKYSFAFIYPTIADLLDRHDLPTNIATHLSILSSSLKNAHIDTKLVDLNLEYLKRGRGFLGNIIELSLRAIERDASGCDAFGFTSICSSHALAVLLAKAVKKRFNKPIIFGGPHPTLTAGHSMEAFPWIDYIVKHEGEITLVELLETIRTGDDPSKVRGIAYRRGGRVRETGLRGLIGNLDDSPFPDVGFIDIPAYQALLGAVMIPIDNGRGCPYSCSFCATSKMWRRKVRMKSPQRVIAEMDAFHETYGECSFYLNQDNLTSNREAVMRFCNELRHRTYRWFCCSRCDTLDEELLASLKSSGCTTIYLGIESGSAVERKRMHKNLATRNINDSINMCLKHGVGLKTSYIIGFPNQTKRDLNSTIKAALRDASIDAEVDILMFAPMPGTHVFSVHKNRLVPPPTYENRISPFFVRGNDASAMKRMVLRNPEIFSAQFILKPHSFPIEYLYGAEFLFNYLVGQFPITTFLLMRWSSISPTDLLDRHLRYYGQNPLKPVDIRTVGPLLARAIQRVSKRMQALADIFTHEMIYAKLREQNSPSVVTARQRIFSDEAAIINDEKIMTNPEHHTARLVTDVHKTIKAINKGTVRAYPLKSPATYIFYEDALHERLISFPLDPVTELLIKIAAPGIRQAQLIEELERAFPQWLNLEEYIVSLLNEGLLIPSSNH